MSGRSVDDLATELARLRREYDDFRSTTLARFPTSDRLQGAVHHWVNTGSRTISHNETETFTGWSTVIDGGIATRSGGDFFLNRAGRWSILLDIRSDATISGVFKARLNWNPSPFGVATLEDARYRGAGFPNAGNLSQFVSWSGWVEDSTHLTAAITCQVFWNASDGSTSTNVSVHRLSLNYMGSS